MGHSLYINDDMVQKLRSDWWRKLVGGQSLSAVGSTDLYESIVARYGTRKSVLLPFTHLRARARARVCVCVCVCVCGHKSM